MPILITGGAGYIGSHTCVELLNARYDIIVVDNFSNSKPLSLRRVQEITGKTFKFYNVDILNREELEKVFEENDIEAIIHFAGFKSVCESIKQPIKYYYNNITGTLVLCDVMKKYNVKKLYLALLQQYMD